MRLVTYDRRGSRRLGAWVDGTVVDLPDAVGHPAFPLTMEALVARNGGTTLDAARHALEQPHYLEEYRVVNPRLLVPFIPPAFRSHRNVLGPEEDLPLPGSAEAVDYQVEVACVIGQPGHDFSWDEAASVIFGYMLMNDWSADPGAAGERFAVSLGPWMVTPDEFDGSTGRILARIDGQIWSTGDLAEARGTFPDLVATESRGRVLFPGDVIGSGTFPGGSGRDLGRSVHPGAVVELEADGLGVLRNRVAEA